MTEQLSLLMGARNSDPATSHLANVSAPRETYYRHILDAVALRPDGMSCDELLAVWPSDWPYPVQRNVLSKRLGELLAVGELTVLDQPRLNPRNRWVLVYRRPVRAT